MNLLRFRPTLTDSLTCFFRFPPGLRRSSTGKVRKPLVILQMKHQRETLWVTWLQRPNPGEDPKIGRYRRETPQHRENCWDSKYDWLFSIFVRVKFRGGSWNKMGHLYDRHKMEL